MDDIIDLGALRAERSELANRIAAIDKILQAVAALDGSVGVSNATGSTGTGRQRRTNQEVEEIKAAIAAELSREPGSKNDISQRLQAKGILTGSRRDRELVQRTLKELVESEAATLVGDTYTSTEDGHLTVDIALGDPTEASGATEPFDHL